MATTDTPQEAAGNEREAHAAGNEAAPDPDDEDEEIERSTRVAEPVFDEEERTTSVHERPDEDDSTGSEDPA